LTFQNILEGNIPVEEEEEVDEFGRKQTVITSAVSMHETFFSCVQAACYIVCFYGVEVANSQRNVRTTQKKWQKVLTCTLQPLRFCLQSVRVEFLRLAQQVGMLEESSWSALPSDVLQNVQADPNRKNNGNVNMGAGFNPLDSFFPYDPCLLRMLHQPIEKYYRVWRGVPGLDDVAEVEIEVEIGVLLDESRIIEDDVTLELSTDALIGASEMGLGSHGDRDDVDDIVRSRNSSLCSDSESDVSHSVTSSMHLSFSQAQSRSQSMDVSTAMSMTESVGIGLLEEREKEKVQGRGTDSRAQSMVSDCSLEDDSNTHSPHSNSHSRHSGALPTARVPSFSQFSGIVSPPRFDPGSDGNNDLTDAGGWPIPARRPRQDSTCSNGSW
jgi:RNA polymerase I specific transcription initiation factor RRN3